LGTDLCVNVPDAEDLSVSDETSVAPVDMGTNNDLGRFGDDAASSLWLVRFALSKLLVLEVKTLPGRCQAALADSF